MKIPRLILLLAPLVLGATVWLSVVKAQAIDPQQTPVSITQSLEDEINNQPLKNFSQKIQDMVASTSLPVLDAIKISSQHEDLSEISKKLDTIASLLKHIDHKLYE